MAQIDTSFYRGLQGPTAAQGLGSLASGLQSIKQSRLADLAMKQREFDYNQSLEKAKREEEERKRQMAQREEFMAQYQTAQMEGEEQLTPEQMQGIYANVYPQQYAQQQVKSALSRDPYAERRLKVQEGKERRLTEKDETRRNQFAEKQRLDYKKFLLAGEKNKEQIRQFEEKQAMQREQMQLELSKPERERDFDQKNYRAQLPEYLQSTIKPSKIFTQGEITEVRKANNSYGDIYKKVKDLEGLVPSPSAYVAAKGTGETAGLVRSQVAQIITDYNRNVAELGALAGQDLTILEEAIPSPSQWKAMTYSTWKKTIGNLKKNIKEKYQGLMRNSDIRVSGSILDTLAKQSRIITLTSEDEGLIRK